MRSAESAEHQSQARLAMWLREALDLRGKDTPFPWQEELLRRFLAGSIPGSIDIPTGLGKTAVMAIWLVARAHGAAVPRRLAYIVDRRAVVDQATEVAVRLREYVDRDAQIKEALGLGTRSLPISTLRGQHVDNREWLEDPSSPSIIVGTVDMVGSRLLFEGYGTTRKIRPYQAGLLGADSLAVLDEAHLVPPFEKLLEAIAEDGAAFGPRDEPLRRLVPPFKLLSLSATGRDLVGESFGLREVDLKHLVVRRRLDASKRLTVLPLDDQTPLADALAEHAWELSGKGADPVRCIVFTDKRTVAVAVRKALEKLAKGDKNAGIPAVRVDMELFVGGRRVFEREDAALRLARLGFIASTKVEREGPAFVIATSAGEVGVDLDADHMVSDLVAWERMVQRLGRVNRRGEPHPDGKPRVAEVVVVVEPPSADARKAREKLRAKKIPKAKELAALEAFERLEAVSKVIDHLPQIESGARDASSGALRALKERARGDAEIQRLLDAATTPAPLRPGLTRALVDAWSMTSLKEHTGRPEVDPWLRGWLEDKPQTAVVWRVHLPTRSDGAALTRAEMEAFFEAAMPHASELLETESFRVADWLATRARTLLVASNNATPQADKCRPLAPADTVAVVLDRAGDLRRVLKLEDLQSYDKEARDLAGSTLVLDARVGGLSDGLLDNDASVVPPTADDGERWIAAEVDAEGGGTSVPVVRFRVRAVDAPQPILTDGRWRERLRVAIEKSEEGDATRWLVVDKWRHDASTEEDRSMGRPQRLEEHRRWTEDRARALARRLDLPDGYAEMLAVSARLHDEGKQVRRWQRAFNAPKDAVYAKTRGPVNTALLDGYRHELGSLPLAASDPSFRALSGELQDLALHLIAAHHGFGRPVIRTSGCEDAPPSALEERAREVALRFARLQRRWGPWGLAWWEALLRAADQQASRENDAPRLVATQEGS